MVLYYFRWEGPYDELQKMVSQLKTIYNEIEDAEIKGVYLTSELLPSHVAIAEVSSYEKATAAYKKYIQTIGLPPYLKMAGTEILTEPEELGLPSL